MGRPEGRPHTGNEPGGTVTNRYLYRSNPQYVLHGLDYLDAAQRHLLVGSSSGSDIAGLLFPVGSADSSTVKAVDSVTASLFEQAAVPIWLPSPLRPALSGEELGDLVGAEVLEIQVAGRFLTGIEALAKLFPSPLASPSGRLPALSLEAIVYAESLRLGNQAVIADRLYAFHRVAMRASWRTAEYRDTFSTTMNHATPHGLRSDPRWAEIRQHPWRAHRRRDVQEPGVRATLKLYISPTTDSLAGVAADSIPLIMKASGVLGWKLASTVDAMVRPDKFVVYLDSRRALQDLASELSSALAGAGIHGVPFTCDAGQDGLLSWGADPPASPHGPAPLVDSWRTWVAARLANGLLQAQQAGLTGREAHAAAIRRAQAAGIDTCTWQPTPASLSVPEDGAA
jgi:hypothetical protein